MLPCPSLLHIFVVHIDIFRLVTEFPEVDGVTVWPTKLALNAHPPLFRIRPSFQPRVLSVQPAQELRIIRTQDQEFHTLPLNANPETSAWATDNTTYVLLENHFHEYYENLAFLSRSSPRPQHEECLPPKSNR